MILQRLVEYYDRLADDPSTSAALPKPGFSLQKISFCVVLDSDGALRQFASMLDQAGKRAVPRQMLVPGQSKPSGSGINPCLLWDNAAYMLGFKPDDPKPQRIRESFEAFRQRHLEAERDINSPAFSAVCRFLEKWNPDDAAARAAELKEITGSFGVFRLAGQERFVHEDPSVVSYWMQLAEGDSASLKGHCLVTGELASVARLHEPKIKGVWGTQAAGATLVAFNDKAYESFGREQSYNAPVSIGATFKYTNALNYLLACDDRRVQLGDASVVFWSERPTKLENLISDLFGENAPVSEDVASDSAKRAEEARLYLSQARDGVAQTQPFDPEDQTRFYILGLSPNAARISIRFWIDSTVGQLRERLAQHMADLDLASSFDNERALTIRRLLLATGRAETNPNGSLKGFDADSISPVLSGALARAVLTGGPYPQLLLSAMIDRMRSDGVIHRVRIAAVKACIVRNSRIRGEPKEVPVALDINRKEPAYVMGRLFALLEKIQADSAGGEMNSTIKDRYFSAASATPGIVFPRLIRLAQHHMAKLDGGLKVHREQQLGEAMSKLERFDSLLTLEDQGIFAVGYYHQRQDLFTSRKNKEGAAE